MKKARAIQVMGLTLLALLLVLSVAGACARPAPSPTPAPAPSPAPAPKPAPKPAPAPSPAPAPKPAPKPAPALPAEVDIATYPIGTNAYVVATGWAAILGKNTPMRVVAKPLTGPSVYNSRVNAGEFAIGVDTSASMHRAWVGEGEYEGKKMPNLRALWQSYVLTHSVPLMVRKDSKYQRAEDLKGARVASDYGGNLNIPRYITVVLAGAGLTWNDVVKVPVASMTGGWDALREGRVDVAYGGTITSPAAVELHAAIGIRFIGYSRNPVEIPEYQKLLPGQGGSLLKPAPGLILDRELWGELLPFWFVASTHLSEEAAYQIVKAVWEHDTEIQPILPIMKDWSRKMILGELTVPVHPGAIRFYKEKGVWTPQLEQKQAALLKS